MYVPMMQQPGKEGQPQQMMAPYGFYPGYFTPGQNGMPTPMMMAPPGQPPASGAGSSKPESQGQANW